MSSSLSAADVTFGAARDQASRYELPTLVRQALFAMLTAFPSAHAVVTLATYIARHWATPTRLGSAFPVDRRAIHSGAHLDLSEWAIRSALQVLLRIGFLVRVPVEGSRYRRSDDGWRRKAALYRFGPVFEGFFRKAARKALCALHNLREALARKQARSRSALSHKYHGSGSSVLMGERVRPPPDPETNTRLEAALGRLLQGIRASRDGPGEGGASFGDGHGSER